MNRQPRIAGHDRVKPAHNLRALVAPFEFQRHRVTANQGLQRRRPFAAQEILRHIRAVEQRLAQKPTQFKPLRQQHRPQRGQILRPDDPAQHPNERALASPGCSRQHHHPLRQVDADQRQPTPPLHQIQLFRAQRRPHQHLQEHRATGTFHIINRQLVAPPVRCRKRQHFPVDQPQHAVAAGDILLQIALKILCRHLQQPPRPLRHTPQVRAVPKPKFQVRRVTLLGAVPRTLEQQRAQPCHQLRLTHLLEDPAVRVVSVESCLSADKHRRRSRRAQLPQRRRQKILAQVLDDRHHIFFVLLFGRVTKQNRGAVKLP